MNSAALKYDHQESGNRHVRYQDQTDTDHIKKLMRRDVTGFYSRISATGRRVIAALIQSVPAMDKAGEPFPFVVSSLQHAAGCSKLSVLRSLPKGEQAGLFSRKIHHCGRRHGTVVTLYKERCELFIKLFKQEYGLLADTETDRHQEPVVTNGDRYQDYGINSTAKGENRIPPIDISDKTDALFSRLSDQGRRVLGIISTIAAQNKQEEISLVIQSIARNASCSEVTARRVIKQGNEAGLYTKRTHERGPRFGIILKLNKVPMERIRELLQDCAVTNDTNPDRYQAGVTKHDRYHDRNDTNHDTSPDRYHVTNGDSPAKQVLIPCLSRVEANHASLNDTNGDRYQPTPILDRQIKNLSGSEENEEERWARRLLLISTDEFQVLWPRLHDERFGPDQIRQIVEHRLSFSETVLDIENSLHAAEWELENNTFPETRKGRCNYLFATLKSKGTWRRPAGFMTPNEQALANAKKEKSIIRELQELDRQKAKKAEQDTRNEMFETWLTDLSPEEQDKVDALCPMPISTDESRRTWRKSYWNKQINRAEA
ncbi:hypothetical protein [Maridesulfovibrio sp. FT414]|uniref:hypothetical protein n=1 Tax=Maridesulfovibrio sp. FT414 TaxID=2979469 RepID=UPI003D800E5D